jgi:LPS export ABC transporter protein LptC
MDLLKKHQILLVVILIAAVFFVGCESNFKEIQKSNFSEFVPSGEAEGINLKYTDSGRITAILVSPKMKEFATVDFPFTEFPKGVDVTLYDKNKKRTIILADYATSYKLTNVIDLKGNVKITSQDGQILETDQLYFDQKNEWFYTEKSFKFTHPKGVSNGQGIDFSKDFKIINSQRIAGAIDSED